MLADVRTARQTEPLNSWAAAIEALILAGLGRHDDAVQTARMRSAGLGMPATAS